MHHYVDFLVCFLACCCFWDTFSYLGLVVAAELSVFQHDGIVNVWFRRMLSLPVPTAYMTVLTFSLWVSFKGNGYCVVVWFLKHVILVRFNFSNKHALPSLETFGWSKFLHLFPGDLGWRLSSCLWTYLGSPGCWRGCHFLFHPRQALVTKPAEAPFPKSCWSY